MNYTTLQADVAAYLKRSDLTTPITRFIEQARRRIGVDLRSAANYVSGSVTTFSNGRTALPANLAQLVSVTWDGVPLVACTNSEIAFNQGQHVYAVEGSDLYVPDAGAADTVDLTYYTIPAALSAGADVSEGMDEFPQLWIYAATIEGARYVRDPDLELQLEAAYQQVLAACNRTGYETRYGPGAGIVDSARNVFCSPPDL